MTISFLPILKDVEIPKTAEFGWHLVEKSHPNIICTWKELEFIPSLEELQHRRRFLMDIVVQKFNIYREKLNRK